MGLHLLWSTFENTAALIISDKHDVIDKTSTGTYLGFFRPIVLALKSAAAPIKDGGGRPEF
jgi:hypothetical protein